MTNIYKGIVPFLFLIFLGISCSADVDKHGSLMVEDDLIDFGFLPIDYRVSHTFKIKNVGQDDLNISGLFNNCDCTTARISKREIPPGDSSEINMVFHTKNYYGQTIRTITILSDDPEKPEYELKYRAELGLFPKKYKTNPISLILLPSNEGKTINILNLSDDDIDFAIEYTDKMFFDVDINNGTIEAKDSVSVFVSPLESIPPGTHYCNFTVVYKAEKNIRLTIPVRVVKF